MLHQAPRLLLLSLLLPWAATGCYEPADDDDDDTVIVNPPDMVAADFQSIADYLDSPVVEFLLSRMPRYTGSTPPNVEGEYDSTGEIIETSIPGTFPGNPVTADFCFSAPAGSRLEVLIQDPTVQDGGAASFIEGSGDRFTVYTAFKSVQRLEGGGTCEIHEVNLFSATRNADGSLSDLFIGQGIVGLIGDCGTLFVGDYQISDNRATRAGGSCVDSQPGTGPSDPRNVLVEVENNLVVDLLVFLDDDTTPALLVAPLAVGSFETRPGFALYFEGLQPIAGQDDQGDDLLMGEIVAGQFAPDSTPAGDAVIYAIENQVGSDHYFAPLPVNRRSFDIYTVTNLGAHVPGYPPPTGSGLDCLCFMVPSPDPYVIGYYSYSVPGIIAAAQANVHFFRTDDNREVAVFQGPFPLEPLTGAVTLVAD